MDASAIQVLQRADGYLRLRLPAPLRSPETGAALESSLRALPGVVRTSWLTVEGKLAVRFDPQRLTHADVARRIKALLPAPDLEPQAAAQVEPAPPPDEPTAVGPAERLEDLRAKLIAAAPERFRPLVESATTEKAVTNFFNDIVAFYLIKTHWDLIVNRWIKEPVKYGNAWLTVFYLVFLLVRYRKS
ncbi:MAG: hypothetical protein AB1544_11290 [Pseudomonadota bacterium]|jgi:hypothetical protein